MVAERGARRRMRSLRFFPGFSAALSGSGAEGGLESLGPAPLDPALASARAGAGAGACAASKGTLPGWCTIPEKVSELDVSVQYVLSTVGRAMLTKASKQFMHVSPKECVSYSETG